MCLDAKWDVVAFCWDSPDCKGMRADEKWFTIAGCRWTGDVETQRCRDSRDHVSKPGYRSERVPAAAESHR